jgi:hypothetical protein
MFDDVVKNTKALQKGFPFDESVKRTKLNKKVCCYAGNCLTDPGRKNIK